MKWTAVALAALWMVPSAGSVFALPAPMSPEQLEKESDVVATVRVLAVVCPGEVGPEGSQVPVYQAWLQIVEAKKGLVRANATILVQWQELPKKPVPGPWRVQYLPGEEVQTHLKWIAETRTYATTWWNAKSESKKPAEVTKLPEKAGQIVAIKGLAP